MSRAVVETGNGAWWPSRRLVAVASGTASVVEADLLPAPCQRHVESTTQPDRRAVLLRHAVLARRRVCEHRALEVRMQVALATDDDHHVAGVVARPPQPVVVVTRDRRWQSVVRAEEVDRARLAVVVGEDRAAALLVGSE